MLQWLRLSNKRKITILSQVSQKTGLPAHAIEKDWWVTVILKAAFSTKWNDRLIFKGGTSLSKSWELIERFSEDIDLAIDRSVFGVQTDEELTTSGIKKIRKLSCSFVSNTLLKNLQEQLDIQEIPRDLYELLAEPIIDSDQDPQIIICSYKSVLNPLPSSYIKDRVVLEVGARSLVEPCSKRSIISILDSIYLKRFYAGNPFTVQTVLPKRTFLEKAFLLHEEFLKPDEKIHHDRKSRHLYDLERLMDTTHGHDALKDIALFKSIVKHREKFNLQKFDYTTHFPLTIDFIPRERFLKAWENDYINMTENMIYGKTLQFEKLISRLVELRERFRNIEWD